MFEDGGGIDDDANIAADDTINDDGLSEYFAADNTTDDKVVSDNTAFDDTICEDDAGDNFCTDNIIDDEGVGKTVPATDDKAADKDSEETISASDDNANVNDVIVGVDSIGKEDVGETVPAGENNADDDDVVIRKGILNIYYSIIIDRFPSYLNPGSRSISDCKLSFCS